MIQCRKLSALSAIVISASILFVATPSQAAKSASSSSKPSAQARLHKCTDDKGRVIYSDRPDLECPQSVEMSKQALKLDKPVPAQPAVPQSQSKAPSAESVEQARRDKAIMQTYTSESQIEEAKERNLELPMQAVKLAQKQLDRAIKKRDALKNQSDALTMQKKPLPAGLTEDLQLQEAEVARLEQEIARRQTHSDQIAARFDAELRRYRELTGVAAAR